MLKQRIEDDRQQQEEHFRKVRNQLDEQKRLIESQRKHLNELQALNEQTQSEITKAARDLAKQTNDKEQVLIQMSEEEQASLKLKSRFNGLKN